MTQTHRAAVVLASLGAPLALGLILLAPKIYAVVITHAIAVPAVLYVFVYRGANWKKGATGRALMNKARSMALLLVLAIVGYWWPFPGYEYLYDVALSYLGVAVTYQLIVMWRLRRLDTAPTEETDEALPEAVRPHHA